MRQIKPKLRYGVPARAAKTQNHTLQLVAGLRITVAFSKADHTWDGPPPLPSQQVSYKR